MRRLTDRLRQWTAPAVHASPTAADPSLLKGLGVAAVAALFLSASGAFGTGGAAFPIRLGYWALTLGIGAGLGMPLADWLSRRGRLGGPAQAVILLTVCLGLPLTLQAWALAGWIFNGRLDLRNLPGFALPVLVITAAMSTLNVLISRQPTLTHAPPPGGPSPPAPVKFLERLPLRLRGAALHAVQAEDHYLRLHTDRGSDLILMRLSDAVAELEGLEGAQTHRSWWVARDAVIDADRSDGRAVLKLKSGAEAPVSRTYARALREAGWF